MDSLQRLAKKIAKINKTESSGYDTTAEVIRTDENDGTVYVHIAGGADETPCQMTISCKVGDTVKVRISGGRCYIIGNVTAPPTDDSYAKYKLAIIDKLIAKTVKVGEVVGDKFKLSADGVLTCKDAVLSGTINAIKGKIGDWSIGKSDESEFNGISYEDERYQAFFAPDYLGLLDKTNVKTAIITPNRILISQDAHSVDIQEDEVIVRSGNSVTTVSPTSIICNDHINGIGTIDDTMGGASGTVTSTSKAIGSIILPAGTWIVIYTGKFEAISSAPANHSVRLGFTSNYLGGFRRIIPSGANGEIIETISWIFSPGEAKSYDIYAASTYTRGLSQVACRAVRII